MIARWGDKFLKKLNSQIVQLPELLVIIFSYHGRSVLFLLLLIPDFDCFLMPQLIFHFLDLRVITNLKKSLPKLIFVLMVFQLIHCRNALKLVKKKGLPKIANTSMPGFS